MGWMAFSQDFISKVLEANDIVDIIGQDAQLKGRGSQFMGLCPFPNHRERTPSFSVNQDKQVYHCFGCKESGNLVTYLREIRGMSFPEAIEFLAQRAGIPIPKEEQVYVQSEGEKDKKKTLFKINEAAALFFHRHLLNLAEDHPVRQYLKRRGITSEAVSLFQIGYAPDSWESLTEMMTQKKAPLNQVQQLGLIKSRSQGKSGYYDIFRHRLMFPIISPMGNYIGFGGRVLKDEQPKYLNSPESDIFHKGKILYGLNETAKFVRAEDQVIVVEGYTDFLALYMAGVKNVVATLGTALTENHARLIRRYTKNVLVLFDGDNAGQMAAERSLPILLSQGLYPKAFSLPNKQDPDEFLKDAGVESFRQRAQESKDLFIQFFEDKNKGSGTEASDKVKVLDQVGPVLNVMLDVRLRELYVEDIALRWGVSTAWIHRSLKGEQRPSAPSAVTRKAAETPPMPKPSSPKPVAEVSKIQLKGAPKAEIWAVNAALTSSDALKELKEADIRASFSHEGIRQVYDRMIELDRQMPSKFDSLTSLLMAEVEPAGDLGLHLEPSFQLPKDGIQKMIQDCVSRIRADHKKRELREIQNRLRHKKGSDSIEELEQIMNIHRDKQFLDHES